MKNTFFISLLFLISSFTSFGQLTVQNGLSAQQLGEILAGDNIQVGNASISGNSAQYGSFSFSGNGLDVSSGVILSSGSIFDAPGPNSSPQTSTDFGGQGNTLLTQLAGQQTYDATILQFDFTVQSNEINFNFIFLSEEYNEYVGSSFNDVFAFYISGPGINGEENLAVVPGTTTPVSINTINNDSFFQFYHDNTDANTNIEYDGFTTLMTAKKTGLQTCETYTLKLMIADASDGVYDAAVLLQENSLIQPNISASSSTYSDNNTALEGCINADFNFQLDKAVDYDVQIPIEIAGSAVNGVDYEYIDPVIVIPAGQTKGSIIINSYSDGVTEGQEDIKLIYSPSVCEDPDTVMLYINDFEPIEFTAATTETTCSGGDDGSVLFNISGGFSPYTINLTDTNTNETNSYTTNPINGLEAGTYSVEIIDSYGCKADDIIFGDVFNAGTTFLPTGTGVTYETSIDVTGFDNGELLETIDQFKQVSATIEHSYANDLEIFLEAPNGTRVKLKQEGSGYIGNNPNNSCDFGEPVASGRLDHWNADNITPGIGYQYVWNLNPTYGTMSYMVDNQLLPEHTYTSTYGNELTDYYYPSGSYTPEGNLSDFIGTELNGTWKIIVTDFYILDNGYIFEWSLSLSSPQSDSIITISQPNPPIITSVETKPDCGMSDGAIDITVSDMNPTAYLWNTGATTEDINNISAGVYSVNITGDDGCDYDFDFNLSNNGNLTLSANLEQETCVGANDGSVDLTVSGGTPNFTYLWNNGETTEDISNLAPANYTVTVNDAANCIGVETFTIAPASDINIEGVTADEQCSNREGSIDITVSGGISPYNFSWSNGETTQNINELQQGDYTVTVTDVNGCSKTKTFNIVNYVGNCIPDCDLAITYENLTDETCGQANGAVDLTIFTTNSPYSVSWSNGSTTDDISGISEGTYTISITDNAGCEFSEDYTINNQTDGLKIISITPTDEACGNGNGSVDLGVSGGALPYTFAWNTGETSEDLSGLSEGIYSVTVTDNNQCSVSESVTVNNDAGDLHQTWHYVVNEICGNGQGSIDILVEGGQTFYNGEYHYLWSNGETTKGISNLSAGNYFCTITDANGCKITTDTYTLDNVGGNLNIDYIDVDNEICGNNSGSIELEISGGTLPYTFVWNTGETIKNIYNISAGTYENTITDANGCTISTGNLIVLNESGTLSLDDINVTDEHCNDNLGAIDISVSGGTGNITYSWSNGALSEDLTGLNEGNYGCVITDDNGCELSFNTTVNNDNGAINIENIIVTNEICGNSNGAADISVIGAAAPVSYNWSNGDTNEDLINVSAGNYNVTVTDNIGCQTSASVTVINETGSLSLDNAIVTNEECGGSNGSVNLVVSGDAVPISFLWNTGDTNEDLTNIPAGDYYCIITDNNGCKITSETYIVNNNSSTITGNAQITDETCGNGNGGIDITVKPAGTYTFSWSNGATSEDLTNISAGTYSVSISDGTCTISESYTVNNNSGNLKITSFTKTNEICGNGNGAIDITVNANNPTFVWSNGALTEDISGISAGQYYVTVTDDGGCQITSDIFNILNNPGAFALSHLDVNDEYCNNSQGSAEITVENGTNPISYNWSNGGTNNIITGLSQGTYNCIATDANGCELNVTATVINQTSDLSLDNIAVTDETCGNGNGAIDITVSGTNTAFSYIWNTGQTSEDLTDLSEGNYSCTITDTEGCYVIANANIENLSGNFAIINSQISDEHCDNNGGEIDITVSGGQQPYNFSWNNGATSEDLTYLQAGTYSVLITDNLGCSVQGTFDVLNAPNTLNIDDAVITDEICGDGSGSIDITCSGGYGQQEFRWSNGETVEDISGLHSGNYEILITDIYGCTVSNSYFVDNNTGGFEVQSVKTDETCGHNNASIDLTVTGGSHPYSFEWSNGATTEDLTNIDEGTYTCRITDASGCVINISETIENIGNGTAINLVSITDDQCASSSGSINITVSGGTSPFTFLWNNGETSQNLTNVTAGQYFVTVTDNTGCSVTSEIYTVNNSSNEDIAISNVNIQPDFCGMGYGSVYFEPATPGNYTYELNGMQGIPPFDGLMSGDYVISIIDGNCRKDSTITVVSKGIFTVIVDNVQNETCGQQNGAIELSIAQDDGSFSYQWSNGENTQDIYNLPANEYNCTITHGNSGCIQTISKTIINETDFIVSATKTNETCENSNGEINLTVNPAGTYTFNWNTGATDADISGLAAGTYTCIVTDNNGCSDNISETIINNENNLDVSETVQNSLCNQSTGSIDLNISGAPLGYSVLWNNGEITDFLHDIPAGTYSVTVTDAEFLCQYYFSYDVDENPSFNVTEIITGSSCETCSDGAIDITVEPAGTYTFMWSNGATTEDISNLLPGNYSVIISDNSVCEFEGDYSVGNGNSVNNSDTIFVKVYPNPAEKILKIEYNAFKENSDIKIINAVGSVIYENKLPGRDGVFEIDMSGYSTGVYYLFIKNKREPKAIKIIKKNH